VLRLVRSEQVILSLLAGLVGVAAAYGSIGFRELIALIQGAGFASMGGPLVAAVAQLPWWQIVAVPALGGLAVGLLVRFFQAGARPHGVAEVMEASVLRGGRIALKQGVVAALGATISIGSGASVGREGPAVHIGASLASWLGQRLKLSRSLSLTLLGCGVAAAVSASFNAPIAGAFFALEVVIGHYALSAFAPVVIASVAGTIVARVHLGDYPAFILGELELVSFLELPAFALLGVVSAGVAVVFMHGIFLPNRRGSAPSCRAGCVQRSAALPWARLRSCCRKFSASATRRPIAPCTAPCRCGCSSPCSAPRSPPLLYPSARVLSAASSARRFLPAP
jgi:CIC family chloride channel protein